MQNLSKVARGNACAPEKINTLVILPEAAGKHDPSLACSTWDGSILVSCELVNHSAAQHPVSNQNVPPVFQLPKLRGNLNRISLTQFIGNRFFLEIYFSAHHFTHSLTLRFTGVQPPKKKNICDCTFASFPPFL